MKEIISTGQNIPVQKPDKKIDWLKFPVHERLSRPDAERFLEGVHLNYHKLETIAQSGPPAEKTRARLALKAYARVEELLNQIRDLQEEMKQASK